MAKGPQITDEVKRFIAEVNDEYPDWVGKQVTKEVQTRLHQINHQVKLDWPGLSTVQIELQKIRLRKMNEEISAVDNPWNLGKLTECPIPPEAVPKVLEIQGFRCDHNSITIREVKWVGRLHVLTNEIMELAIWAALYAKREKFCERAGIEINTSDIDSCVQSKIMAILGYFPWLFQRDWVPDSYKKQVAEEQTQQYEKVWGLNLDRPDFNMNGWLVYANCLQGTILFNKENEHLPDELRALTVLGLRQIAKNEGRIMFRPGKYFDLLECITTGEVHEKSYNHIKEVYDVSSISEMKEGIDRLLGIHKTPSESAIDKEG